MVTITSDLLIADQPTLRLYSNPGTYNDVDLILMANVSDMATPVAMLQAQFVKYGPIVYQFNTPEDLGKAVLAIDPSSTLDAAVLYQQEAARDAARAAGTLTPGGAVGDMSVVPDTAKQPIQQADQPTNNTSNSAASATPTTDATSSTPSQSPADIIAADQQTIDEDQQILNVLNPTPNNSTSSTTPSIASSTPAVDPSSIASTTDSVASTTSP